jgi:hypothetical protein
MSNLSHKILTQSALCLIFVLLILPLGLNWQVTAQTSTITLSPTSTPTTQAEWILSVSQIGDGSVQVISPDNTTPIRSTGIYTYPDGTTLTLQTHKHHDGWRFDHWLIDGTTFTDWKTTITMNSDHIIEAYFVPWNYTLSISNSVGGFTNPTGDHIYPVMAPDYPLTNKVTITAYPYDNYKFDHWLWDDTIETNNPISVSIDPVFDTNHKLHAVFTPIADAQGQFVGSKNSDIYHYPTCSHVDQIILENKIWFDTAQEASNKGYTPCLTCKPPPAVTPSTPLPTVTPSTPLPTISPAYMPSPASTSLPMQTTSPVPNQNSIQPDLTSTPTTLPSQTPLQPTTTPNPSPDLVDSPPLSTPSSSPADTKTPSDPPINTANPIQSPELEPTTPASNIPSTNLESDLQAQEGTNYTVIVVLFAIIVVAILLTIFGKKRTP